ncbi:alpha/beta fold hydrolase [Piscirickettsia litoralis]|uniref:AB hydrolase-1 domain-containing protein n=1 Tax=Piscirickettsia litoralis TaxID=1891921 RepID=A0ABX3A2G4_9GAMM|nr:alpha/beta hydrolase [Piscirickettsia litoralis]ODN41841.1 hypothetical protein BGC07_01180 [Piscirickettsia litoralis]
MAKFIFNNERALYYQEVGDRKAPALLFISGLGQDHSYWLNIAERLKKHYHIILYDSYGTGRSTELQESCSISSMADDINMIMNMLGIEKTHIVGHSMGGFIAQQFSINYPDKVDKLIIYSSGHKVDCRSVYQMKMHFNLIREGALSKETLIKLSMPWSYSVNFFNNKKQVKKRIQEKIDYLFPTAIQTLEKQLEACSEFNSLPFLREIQSETLILCGKEDFLLPVAQNQTMVRKIPGSKLKVVDDASHVLHLEQPEYFCDILIEHCQY